jgi:hypothetical protein
MVNGTFDLSSNALYLCFEGRDAGLEFLDRERIEILAQQRGDGIVGALGQEFVRFHMTDR